MPPTSLVLPLAQGHARGWPSWLYGMLAAAALVLAGFAGYQVRRKRAGRVRGGVRAAERAREMGA
jgi:hypothetical protein